MTANPNRMLEALDGLIDHTHRLEAEVGGRDYLPSIMLQRAENALDGYRAEVRRHGNVLPTFAADMQAATSTRLEAFADAFEREATTPAQRNLAASFAEFVAELTRQPVNSSDAAIKESILAAVPTAEPTPERGWGGRG